MERKQLRCHRKVVTAVGTGNFYFWRLALLSVLAATAGDGTFTGSRAVWTTGAVFEPIIDQSNFANRVYGQEYSKETCIVGDFWSSIS
jgi:hypothetical protein